MKDDGCFSDEEVETKKFSSNTKEKVSFNNEKIE